MADWLVLGSGSLTARVVSSLADRPGSVRVITEERRRADALVETGVEVDVADPSDEAVLGAVGDAETVFVADDSGAANLAVARATRRVFPDAMIVAYAGADADGARELSAVADRVVDPGRTIAGFLLSRVSDDGTRLRQLRRVLRGIENLAVVTHDNPDPDAIGSAIALSRIAAAAGCETSVCYYGSITHQENRAFVNLLEFDLTNLDADDDLAEFDGVALVDHSRPGVNDQLPPDLPIDIVIDHHPPRAPVEAKFVDLRSDAGATSTLLVDYLDKFGIEFDEDVATGLLFGIRVDTQEFTREVSRADFEAAATLIPHANLGTLERIESPSISPETYETIASAITNRRQEGSVVMSCVGRIGDRDALAQAADRLLVLDGVTTTVVYGVVDDTIFVSARSRGTDVDLGETLRDAFSQIGSAGGHADMAGAQVRLGVLEAVEDLDESLLEIVEMVVFDRFMEALDARTVTPVFSGQYDADEYLVDEELDAPAEDDGESA
jgi:nanoRNase/pAp phosphatase (c-di-AMP/oligoRNAs hydrolase)